jgi:hypothetical protein
MNPVHVSFAPALPWPVLIGLGLAALCVVGLSLYGGRRGTVLRALALGLLLLALAEPSLLLEDRSPLKDIVAVVVDESQSQTIGERRVQTEAARRELDKALDALGAVDVRVLPSARQDAGNDGTKLFSVLNAGLADVAAERLAGVVMITDGLVHDRPAEASGLGFEAPLHVLVTGHEGERDRRIELKEMPRFGIVGKEVTIEVVVIDTAAEAEPVALKVRRDGSPVATLIAPSGRSIRVPVAIEHAGQNVVELEVTATPGELTEVNNKAVVTIEGVRDKLKVLLVSGEPHAGERMWRNLLKSDANVDLVHFTILRPPEKQDGTPINELSLIAFPTADLFGRKINEFDLIVFDRYSNQSVLPPVYFDNIVRYVREGGALLLAAGPDFAQPEGLYYSPLGRIAPARPIGSVTEAAFLATISPDGAKHPVTRGLPGAEHDPPAWSRWFRQVDAEVARGHSLLAGAADKPLLVLAREGKGRVALLLTDQMWLWARGFAGGGPHLDLTRRLAHWLMKEPELEEEALRATVRGTRLEIERQTLRGEAAPVEVAFPSGATASLDLAPAEPGLFRGAIDADELGLYRLSDGTSTVLVHVGPQNPREFQDVVSTTETLRPLAEAKGGTVRRIARGTEGEIAMPRVTALRDGLVYGGSDYVAIKRTGASEVKGVGSLPLAIGFLGLALLLGSTVAAWVHEGRGAGRRWSG